MQRDNVDPFKAYLEMQQNNSGDNSLSNALLAQGIGGVPNGFMQATGASNNSAQALAMGKKHALLFWRLWNLIEDQRSNSNICFALLNFLGQHETAAAAQSQMPPPPSLLMQQLEADLLSQQRIGSSLMPEAAGQRATASATDSYAKFSRQLLLNNQLDTALALASSPFDFRDKPSAGATPGSMSNSFATQQQYMAAAASFQPSYGLGAGTDNLNPVPLQNIPELAQLSAMGAVGAELPETYIHDEKGRNSIEEATALSLPESSLSFPLKLYKMLDEAEKHGYADIIRFTPDGRSFKVCNRQRFVMEVMPKWFKMKQFSSFHRQVSEQKPPPSQGIFFLSSPSHVLFFCQQLNFYGFARLNRGSDHTTFHHDQFQRGAKQQINAMRRKRQRTPTGGLRHPDEDRAAALKALMGIQRNPQLLQNLRFADSKQQGSGRK